MLMPIKNAISTFLLFSCLTLNSYAAELAGITVADEITATNQQKLILNGMGLREKMWIDVYVGSLYLGEKANDVAAILAQPGAMRIQMDFVYKEVTSEKLIKAWNDGFEKNQPQQKLDDLQSRIQQFNSYFEQSAKKGDTYVLDYLPGQGTRVTKNTTLLGTIEGEDFKNALIEIWLGNSPADKALKKGMLGL